MVGRASAFADPEIIKMAQRDFVPVVGDDWYTRRRDDAEGKFFRKMSDQTGKPFGANTRQGIYAFTPDGQLLSYKNAGNSAEATRAQLKQALAAWDRLSPTRTRPGAVSVPATFEPDPKYHRERPAGGLTVRVYSRILDKTADGFAPGTSPLPGGDKAGRDVVWLTADEVAALAPKQPVPGVRYPLPASIVTRLVRFHLLDNTRGEPPSWEPEHVRRRDFSLTVADVDGTAVELLLEGDALMSYDADLAKSERGFEVKVRGSVRYDLGKRAVTRFEAAAVGEHWGCTTETKGAREGRSLVGLAFGLADGSRPLDAIPPQWVRNRDEYFGK